MRSIGDRREAVEVRAPAATAWRDPDDTPRGLAPGFGVDQVTPGAVGAGRAGILGEWPITPRAPPTPWSPCSR